MKSEIIITEDGSATLFVPELKEHFHSTFGAVQESMHVYIGMGLNSLKKEKVRIFELGFGTGLNVLLTFLNRSKFERIDYDSMELFPIAEKLAMTLGYEEFLKLSPADKEIMKDIQYSSWDNNKEIFTGFFLKKINASILEYNFTECYDLIYYDAFAPNVQPELWTEDIFLKIYQSMNPGAVLVTYCAKGNVRRIFQQCGLEVERLPGPPGKFEMLRATKR